MRLDPDGYIIPEADLDKVQPEYCEVPQAAAEVLVERLGSRLHSGYVYGSVVRGNAVPGRSDLDLLVVLLAPATDADRAVVAGVAATLRERFPVLADVGVACTHVDEVLSAGERYGWQVFLRDLSVCMCGEDLRPRLPRTRPGVAVAAGFHGDTPAALARARAVLAGATDPDVVQRACRVASRRMVQAAFAVVIARDGVWATVLEEQAAIVGDAFPRWARAARCAAEQGRQPDADASVVGELLATSGAGWRRPWLRCWPARRVGSRSTPDPVRRTGIATSLRGARVVWVDQIWSDTQEFDEFSDGARLPIDLGQSPSHDDDHRPLDERGVVGG